MPAPKGNQYWRNAVNPGRPRKFKDGKELWKACVDWWEKASKTTWYKTEQLKKPITTTHVTPTGRKKTKTQYLVQIPCITPFTYEALCAHIGVSTRYFHSIKTHMDELAKSENKKVAEEAEEFLEVLARIADVMAAQKLEGAMLGAFHAGIVGSYLKMAKYEDVTNTIVVEVEDDDTN